MSRLIYASFVLFVCCIVKYEAAITDAQKSKIQTRLLTSGLDCIKDHPLTFEHIKSFRERKVPDDEEATCFVKCIYKNLGIMNDAGKILEKKARASARKIFPEDDEMLPKVDEIITECLKVNDEETSDGDKGCERAKLAFQCFVEHAPKAVSPAEKDTIKLAAVPLLAACGDELGISREQYLAAHDAKDINALNPCFYDCFFKKIGFLNDDGMFDRAAAKERNSKYVASAEDKEKLHAIGTTCSTVNEVDVSDGAKGCERAKLLLACFIKEKSAFSPIA